MSFGEEPNGEDSYSESNDQSMTEPTDSQWIRTTDTEVVEVYLVIHPTSDFGAQCITHLICVLASSSLLSIVDLHLSNRATGSFIYHNGLRYAIQESTLLTRMRGFKSRDVLHVCHPNQVY